MRFQTSSRHIRNTNETETKKETTADWKQFHLEECKSALRCVLIQWEPVFLEKALKHQKEENGYDSPGLASKTVYIVLKWLVKSQTDSTLDMQHVLFIFRWFKKNVLQNSAMVEEILKDGTLKSGMFKLYISAWSANEEKTVELSHLCLLNGIMFDLLDSQDVPKNNFHETVKKFCCSAMTEEDTMRKGKFFYFQKEGRLEYIPKSVSVFLFFICYSTILL